MLIHLCLINVAVDEKTKFLKSTATFKLTMFQKILHLPSTLFAPSIEFDERVSKTCSQTFYIFLSAILNF